MTFALHAKGPQFETGWKQVLLMTEACSRVNLIGRTCAEIADLATYLRKPVPFDCIVRQAVGMTQYSRLASSD